MNVQIFIPCFVDQLFPETAFNMVRILEKFGCNISYNLSQTCCGQPAYNAGYLDACRPVVAKFRDDFNPTDYIVAPSGSCTGFVRNYHHKVLNGLSPVQKHLYEFTEFLTKILQVDNTGAELKGKAVYHDGCGALRECGIKQSPRILLQNVKSLELQEVQDAEVCCGFGGTFAVKFEPISIAMAAQKVKSAVASGADYLISTDLSCLMHMETYIRKQGIPLRTMHIADVLASGW